MQGNKTWNMLLRHVDLESGFIYIYIKSICFMLFYDEFQNANNHISFRVIGIEALFTLEMFG
jgi:hypothetical protein